MNFFKSLYSKIPLSLRLTILLVRRHPGLGVVNFILQRILRIDSDFKPLKHFTSKILSNNNIQYDPSSYKTLKSFFGSGGCFFQGANGISIGTGTFWSVNVTVMSGTFNAEDFSTKDVSKPIRIGANCWLGANVVILPEVCLGDHTIVGAGSVVTKSFPEGRCIIAGVPARKIRDLRDSHPAE